MSTDTPTPSEAESQISLINPDAVDQAIKELSDNPEQYADLIKVLRDPEKRKDIPVLIKEGTEAALEAYKDYQAVLPAAKNISDAMRTGSSTSEFKTMSYVSKALTMLAVLAPTLEAVMYSLQDQAIFEGNSMWVTTVAVVLKALLAGQYASGRTRIKEAVIDAEAGIIEVIEE